MLEKINVVIYAAGVARRLQSVLGGKHKGLFELEGKSFIERQLDWISRFNVDELVIVLGLEHQAFIDTLGDSYNGLKINYVYNSDYKDKGNMLSLWAAREFCNKDLIFTTSDLYCDPRNIEEFKASTADSKILIDQNTDLYDDPDPVKVKIENSQISRLHKELEVKDVNGLAIGVYQFSKNDIASIINRIEKKISTGEDNLSLYRPIDEIIGEMKVEPVFCTNSNWVDVDTPHDLEVAKRFLSEAQEGSQGL